MELSKTEIRTIFKYDLILLEDTREQKNHISKYFEEKKISVARWRLKQGDYSFLIMPNDLMKNEQPIFFGNEFLIERKSGRVDDGGGFQEIRGNLTDNSKHAAFKAEFQRMEKVNNVYLLIENTENKDCIKKVPTYKRPIEPFIKSFDTFILRRNKIRLDLGFSPIKLIFEPIEDTGETVMMLIFEYLISKYGKKKKI